MFKFNSKRVFQTIMFGLLGIVPLYSQAANVQDKIKEAIVKSGKATNMPNSASIVVFSEPESILITDNPRYVVKGRIFDMWQNVELKNENELQASTQIIPLKQLKVNTKDLLEVRVNQEKTQELTIFLDPFLPSSAQVVHLLKKYVGEYQLRFVLTAMSQESVEHLFDLACQIETMKDIDVLNLISSGGVESSSTQKKCNEKLVMNSFGLTHFLRLKTSPTLIAPNGVISESLPPNLMEWLSENKE